MADEGVVRIGENEVDLDGGQLTRDGVVHFLQPKPLALLRELLRQPGRYVSKAALRSAVWPGVTVTDAAVTSALRDLRRSLGDDGTNPRWIETRRRLGVRLMAPVDDAAGPGPAASIVPPPLLIGRATLLGALEDPLARARAGEGQVVFLNGEPGAGKTRVALALAARARAEGFAVHVGHALEEMDAPPFRPWLQILRHVLGIRTPAELDPDLGGAASEAIVRLLGREPSAGGPPPRFAHGRGERFLVLEAAAATLRAAARERPRMLLLEDLHRADAASLLLLRLLAEEIASVPLFVLGTCRSLEAGPDGSFATTLSELPSTVTQIPVTGLDAEDVEALVAQTAGREPSPELAAAIHERTGGNPLFVKEISRALLAEGRFDAPDAPEWAARSAPEGVRPVIRRRLGALAKDVRRILERASVAGRSFDRAVLAAAWPETDPAEWDRALRSAAEAGLVVETRLPAAGTSFVHDLFREALYEGIPAAARAAMHARIGAALERQGGLGRDGWVDAVAHHFAEAAAGGASAQAVHWGRKAAERAIEVTAYEDAAAHALRALRATAEAGDPGSSREPPPTRTRAELLTLLGRARWLAGAPADARHAFRSALREAEAVGAAEVFARAALGFVGPTDATPGVNQEGVALLERALLLLPCGDGALRAEILARLATELYYDADPARSPDLAARSVAMAERLTDEPLLAYALSAQGYVWLRPEVPPERRLALAERVVELAERSDAVSTLALGLQEKILALLELGDGLGVGKCLDAYARLADRLAQPFLRWLLGLYRGTRVLLEGQVAEAERLAHEAFARGRALGTPNALGAFAAQLYSIRSEQGRLGEVHAPLTALAQEQPDLSVFGAARLRAELARGRVDQARESLVRMVEVDLDRFPRDQNWLPLLAVLADACFEIGGEDACARLAALLEPHAGQVVVTGHGAGVLGAVAHHLGRLAARLGDLDAARSHFGSAQALHERLHAPLWVAHTRIEHAGALLRCGGDRVEAKRLAEEARSAYERFALPHRLAQVQDALGRVPG